MRAALALLLVAGALSATLGGQSHLTADQDCKDGYVLVNGECKEYCSAMNVWTGQCDPNCARWVGDFCVACLGKFHIKEGLCVRLVWVSDEDTLVGDGDSKHSCYLTPPQGGWKLVPGSNFVWDREVNRLGTYLFSEKYVFDQWLQTRMTRVSLDVSVDDYYKIVFNGKTVVEKAGVWDQAPISYDITSFVRKDATNANPNLLEIHATNVAGPGALSYKLVVHQPCPNGADDVDGVCGCRAGWVMLGDGCVQTAWMSGTQTLVDYPSSHNAVLVQQQGGWQPSPGAPFIWDTNINKVGTFHFMEKIVLDDWLRARFQSATITVSADDFYRIIINAEVITNKDGVWNGAPKTFDVTKFFRPDATEANPNILQVHATNTGGPGGVSYKLVVHQKCPDGAEEVDGVCKCKWGFALVSDGCAQVIWTSRPETLVGNALKVPSVVVPKVGGWTDIQGAPWIWDTNTNNVGTFTFTDTPFISGWLRYNTASIDITVHTDDYFQIVLNGQNIVEKAGVWNQPPLNYDLTPYFRTNATAADPNILQITATNVGGPGGLAYKLTVHMKCPVGGVETNGVCECASGYVKVQGRCVKTAWYSDCPETQTGTSYRKSILVTSGVTTERAKGAAHIWTSPLNQAGTFTFKGVFPVVDWVRSRLDKAILEIGADDDYRAYFNGKLVSQGTAVWSKPTTKFEVTDLVKYNIGSNVAYNNELLVEVSNGGGPGLLTYRFALQLKCAIGAEEVNGVCKCKVGYAMWEGQCVQLGWVSNDATQVGDGEIEHSCVLSAPDGAWKLVPGSQYIWDLRRDRVGTYRFSAMVQLHDWVKARLDTLTLDVFADDFYKVVFNNQVVVEKAGTYYSPPDRYDLTKLLGLNPASSKLNLLEIHATNTGGPGALSYKVVAHTKCQANSEDIDGACVCKKGFANINDVCVQGAWPSGPDTMMSQDWAVYPALPVDQQGGWIPAPDGSWVWQHQISEVGTFRFFENIVVPNALKSKVVGASISVSTDDYYKLAFNGKTVTEKAGVWNQPPISYDLTNMLKVDATAANPNLVEIWATNGGGPGGLSYKFVLRLQCGENMEDVEGVCQCKTGFAQIGGTCFQTMWTSGTNTKAGDGAGVSSVIINKEGGWQSVDGAQWIWYQDKGKVGTFRFFDTLAIAPAVQNKVAKVEIVLSVDDYYKLVFNGQTVTERSGVWNAAPITFDLTAFFKANGPNQLEVFATNGGGPGGLAYKLIVRLKCQSGAEDVNGVCKCKRGYQTLGETCIQTAWYSNCPDTEASISTRDAFVINNPDGGWKRVNTADMIWDINRDKVATVTFVEKIRITSKLLERMDKALLEVSNDDWSRVMFNDKVLVEKSGPWNAEPAVFDVTSLVVGPSSPKVAYKINTLNVQVINTGGPGFVSYRFRIVQKCQPGAEDVAGTCKCMWNYASAGLSCIQTAWVSDTETLVGDASKKVPAVIVPPVGGWQLVPGANWIWDTNTNKVGTFNFFDSISLPTALQPKIKSASITLSVDDYYRLTFNDKLVVEKAGVWNQAPITYDITNSLKFSDSPLISNNILVAATNGGGPGALSYKFVLNQKCIDGEVNVDGACVCAGGYARLDGVCTQLEWVSSTNTVVGEGSSARKAVAVSVSANNVVPGATGIWDATINNVGTFTFSETFVISDRFERNIARAPLTLAVDDYYKIVVNGHVVTEKDGCAGCGTKTFDVAAFLLFSDSVYTQKNVLQVIATNGGGPGYISYKLSVLLDRS